jgi:hypothetical protein
MTTKLYVTINAVVALLYGLGFLLIPGYLVVLYGEAPEPWVVLNIQFFGLTLAALSVLFWCAKDFHEWAALRGVLLTSVVADALGAIVNTRAILAGTINMFSWSSTLVYTLLLVGALYCLLLRSGKTE